MKKTPHHLLVIDDDARLRELLWRYLSDHGFNVTLAANAEDARQQMSRLIFDMLIVDVLMPGESGLDFVKDLRALSSAKTPVLMLTAMGEPEQRVKGFEAGANDYLTKPFEPKELLIRIQNILQHQTSNDGSSAEDSSVVLGDKSFDAARGELKDGDKNIKLTESESRLLQVMSERIGQTVSRESLTTLCAIDGGDRAIDVLVTRIRRKIETAPKAPRYLLTIRGKGYVLRPSR